MLIQKDGRWVFVSRKTRRPLAYYRGEGKPSDEWVQKQERRVQMFKSMNEASYPGNIGIMELVKFHQIASEKQKKKFNDHVKNKNNKEAWKLVQHVTGVKLHPSVHEETSADILPKAGAGAWGTDELTKTYTKDTPGQSLKDWKKKHTK
jgi:hypothetical protein